MIPSIDHSLLSPNGRMSKRARLAAIAREGTRLFAGMTQDDFKGGPTPQPSATQRLLTQAARLKDLAARGMNTKKYTTEAVRLEMLASAMEDAP